MTQAGHTTLDPVSRTVAPGTKPRPPAAARHVYMIDCARSRLAQAVGFLSWIKDLGFDTLLLSLPRDSGTADIASIPPIAETAAASGLRVELDLRLDIAGETASIVKRHPDWFRAIVRPFADPRKDQ